MSFLLRSSGHSVPYYVGKVSFTSGPVEVNVTLDAQKAIKFESQESAKAMLDVIWPPALGTPGYEIAELVPYGQ